MTPFAKTPNDLWTRLYYFYFLCLIATVSFIISSALFLQFMYHEIPCPLCLLQRVGYLGICFGIILTLRAGFQPRHMGFSMLFTLFLLVVSERQSLIDIVPRPGHHWIGSAIMGIHMPVWSIIFSLLLLISYALFFCVLKPEYFSNMTRIEKYPFLHRFSILLSLLIVVLASINLIAVFLQCGFSSCHTFYYQLLHA